MSSVQGYWYGNTQSKQQLATLNIDEDGLVHVNSIEPNDNGITVSLFVGDYDSVQWSSRLGHSARYAYCSHGAKFETRDNEGVDRIVHQHSPRTLNTLAHRIESNWRYVFIATVCMLAIGFWGAMYGIPLAAKGIAHSLPIDMQKTAGEQVLKALDQQLFEPSTLDEITQARVKQHFLPIMDEHSEYNIQLHFRASEIGANAFALPGGGIVFTDEMVRLSQEDDELLSVMAHEVGHIVNRHGMRGVIQSSLLGFMLMMLSGDTSAASELFLGIPVILTQLGYSRHFEHEADDYALTYMNDKGIDQQHFVNLMARVDASYRQCQSAIESGVVSVDSDVVDIGLPDDKCEVDGRWSSYLSTHPSLQERMDKFNPSPLNDH